MLDKILIAIGLVKHYFTPMPQLREKLKIFGLDTPTALGDAIHSSRQFADQLLRGKRKYGLAIARKIAKATGMSVAEIVSWQENGR